MTTEDHGAQRSGTDWHRDMLTLETRIDSGYRSTQNVRRFFKRHIGAHFTFTVEFMLWIRQHVGLSLAAVIREWKRRYEP